jgi:poly(3-hydroxyalkanoate) depolymerase
MVAGGQQRKGAALTGAFGADTERIVSVDGQPLRVSVRPGDGSRPPLLLMNGLGASYETLQSFVNALRATTGVVRFDVPGVGGSPAPLFPYRFWWVAHKVQGLLDELGFPQVDVLGVSWGGLLAQQFALQYPSRCRRLVLVSTAPGIAFPGKLSSLIELMNNRRHADHGYALEIAPRVYGGAMRANQAGVWPLAGGLAPDMRGYLYQQLAVLGWSSIPWLPFVSQPTLIMTGDDDPLIPLVNAWLMQQLIPNSRLRVFNDGHLGLMSSAATIAPFVEEFLEPEKAPEWF